MLAAALLNYADDEGYFNANEKLIKAECCPLREDSTSVRRSIDELSSIGYLRLGRSREDGRAYGHVVSFLAHQKVDRGRSSKIKDLDIDWEDSTKDRRTFVEPSLQEGKGREWKGTTTAASRPAEPPEFSEFKAIFPKRAGAQPWNRCLKAIRARLKEGCTWQQILDGARRYAVFVRANGKERTEFVMQAATFCGPDKHFETAFELPPKMVDEKTAETQRRRRAYYEKWGIPADDLR